MSDLVTKNHKKHLVWILTVRGFGSEINNLIYAINYAKQNNLSIGVISTYWNFRYNEGLNDYFKIEEYKDPKISKLLFLYKGFINPLTYAFRKNRFSELTKQALELFIGKSKEKNIFKENLLSYSFKRMKKLLGVESELMFEVFDDIRLFNFHQRNLDREAFILQMNEILLDFWKFNTETSQAIEDKKQKLNLESLVNYAVFHIRRGDKVAAATMEDRPYEVEEYVEKLSVLNPSIKTIFLMTDDYKVFLELKEKFPNYQIHTLSDPISTGHDQDTFNKSSPESKRKHGIDLLTELEIARNGEIFIGSRGSNIFRLVEYFKITGCHDLSDNSNEL
ncbi:hypothetical protein LV84_04206 [Algoriphagus ratkowskyi]|uniref:Alpha-(1,6)-fucosyltransferase N- and catalytic domain-containing protein n=2 Tax=Algoriphagus ratkowskyi TaxID=57028 RepID=A0A2W7RG42_9BACT|nr:hypothetical protein [Algoriphagus ratkowskyi]PZX49675.1 hypothetical protein LV84_04206 [Algoriphagus ratkowskyi]TXD75452.1 hypothetical protein ESW18_20505 [Algoriphagus ratkowskyi]